MDAEDRERRMAAQSIKAERDAIAANEQIEALMAELNKRTSERDDTERARSEALDYREDAMRYRWLRRRTTIGVGVVNIWRVGKGRYDAWQEEELDAAIDSAIAQGK